MSWRLFDCIQIVISKCSKQDEQGASTRQQWTEDRNNEKGGKRGVKLAKLEETCIEHENLKDTNHQMKGKNSQGSLLIALESYFSTLEGISHIPPTGHWAFESGRLTRQERKHKFKIDIKRHLHEEHT